MRYKERSHLGTTSLQTMARNRGIIPSSTSPPIFATREQEQEQGQGQGQGQEESDLEPFAR